MGKVHAVRFLPKKRISFSTHFTKSLALWESPCFSMVWFMERLTLAVLRAQNFTGYFKKSKDPADCFLLPHATERAKTFSQKIRNMPSGFKVTWQAVGTRRFLQPRLNCIMRSACQAPGQEKTRIQWKSKMIE
jgi:hypothetical protein